MEEYDKGKRNASIRFGAGDFASFRSRNWKGVDR